MSVLRYSARIVVVCVLCAMSGLFVLSCPQPTEPPPESNEALPVEEDSAPVSPPIAVEAYLVGRGAFYPAIETSTTIRGIQEVDVISETSGIIQQVNVALGERVAPNQILVRADSELENFALKQAEDQLAVANFELSAINRLIASNNSSAAELARARANVSGAQSSVAQAGRALRNRVIRSPIRGQIAVLARSISRGNYIQPGTRIATIVDLSRLQADILLGETDVLLVNVGDRAQALLSACNNVPQAGSVQSIAAGAEQSGSFTVRVEFVNRCDGRIKSGMSATVAISNADQPNDIIIPALAILSAEHQQYVYVLLPDGDRDIVARRNITVGRVLGNRAEVVAGLEEGDLLVTAPIRQLAEGQLVHAKTIRGNE